MSTSNKYFDPPAPRPEHPRIRAWKSYRSEPAVDHLEVEVRREREGLSLLPASLFVSFVSADGKILRDAEAPWEPELEAWLIDEQGARARTVENEKLRFSLLLKPALRPVLIRYGDGYFNAVLIAGLREGPYRAHPEVADMLRSIHEDRPSAESRADCQALIDHELTRAAQKLLRLYKGERATAEDILGGAIARYLDERFSVTNSRLLGLL
ncbi:MAG: hypothetical protein QM820_28555 [Minicystis sp.]